MISVAAPALVVGADDGVLVDVGQRRRRADGERDRALDLQRRRIARAVELDRAAGDGVAYQLHRAAVIGDDLDGGGGDLLTLLSISSVAPLCASSVAPARW